jgi:hypothetical protein
VALRSVITRKRCHGKSTSYTLLMGVFSIYLEPIVSTGEPGLLYGKRPTNTGPPPDFDGFTLTARSIARISESFPF